jgi:2Fe-2S ferredoxin
MPKITFHPNGKSVVVRRGETVLSAAAKARIFISHKCGGQASCTTCRIKLLTANAFTPPNPRERRKLSEEQISRQIRLACQVLILQDGEVEITPLRSPIPNPVKPLLKEEE